jgi:hypothetical protein
VSEIDLDKTKVSLKTVLTIIALLGTLVGVYVGIEKDLTLHWDKIRNLEDHVVWRNE